MTENEFLKRWIIHYIRPEYFWVPWNDKGLDRAKAYLTRQGVWSANSFVKLGTNTYDYFTWVKVTVPDNEELQKQLIALRKQIDNLQQEIQYVKDNKQDIQEDIAQDAVAYYDDSIDQAMQDAEDSFAEFYEDLCQWVCDGMTGDPPTKPTPPDFQEYEDGAIEHAGLLITTERDRIHSMFNQPPEYPDFTPEEQRVVSDGIIGINNGVQLTTLSVDTSGVYTPPEGYDGIVSVSVNVNETNIRNQIAAAQTTLSGLQNELDKEWRDIQHYVEGQVQNHTGDIQQDYCDADQEAADNQMQSPDCCMPDDPTAEEANPIIEIINPPWDGTGDPPHWVNILGTKMADRWYRYFVRTQHPVSDSVENRPWDTAYNIYGDSESNHNYFCWNGWMQHNIIGGDNPRSYLNFIGQGEIGVGEQYGEANNRLWPWAAGREMDYGYGPGVPIPTAVKNLTINSVTPTALYYNGYHVGWRYDVNYTVLQTYWDIGWLGAYGYHIDYEYTTNATLYSGYEGQPQQ